MYKNVFNHICATPLLSSHGKRGSLHGDDGRMWMCVNDEKMELMVSLGMYNQCKFKKKNNDDIQSFFLLEKQEQYG